ncbi:MAG: ice-binding family protein [Chloroflexota bacterium]
MKIEVSMFALSNVRRRIAGFVLVVGFTTLLSVSLVFLSQVQAQTAPGLGTAASFAVLGGSTVTNTGPTVVTGDLGVSPGSAITGFPPGIVNGAIHTTDAVALQAQSDVTTAYNTLAGQTPCTALTGQDLGGMTLIEGVYCFTASAQLTGTLTLNAQGNAAAVFIFQIGSTLTTASNASVVVENGGTGCNVWWQVGSSATLGTTTAFQGNILALASITLNTGATLLPGRALARTGAVTMDSNIVNPSACVTVTPPNPGLSLSKDDGGKIASWGDAIPYTLTYQNTGDVALNNVIITETIPAGTTFNAGASTPGWNCAGSVCTINVGTLQPGQSGSVVFVVMVDNPTGTTLVSNSATIASGATTATASDTTPVIAPAATAVPGGGGGSPTAIPGGGGGSPTGVPGTDTGGGSGTGGSTGSGVGAGSGSGSQSIINGLPNTGGGPPQATYWIIVGSGG